MLINSQFHFDTKENWQILLLLLFISSFVLAADPESNLDIDKEVPELNVMAILNEKQWREDELSEGEWRRQESGSGSNARWGGYSIHDENPQLDTGSKTILDNRHAAPQFRLKF